MNDQIQDMSARYMAHEQTAANALLDNLELWTGATRAKSGSGRGKGCNSKIELAGIKKLRELILELAVRGKLVPQSPEDEPASELIKRIEEEKARRVAEGKSKKPKKLAPISEQEKPFELPEGWEWVRFGSVTDTRLGKMLDKAKNKGELRPYLRNTNVQWWKILHSDIKQMALEESELNEFSVRQGDLLICEGGEPGRCAIWQSEQEMYFQKALHRARTFCGMPSRYMGLNLEVSYKNGHLAALYTGATIKHLTGNNLAKFIFPLPPLAEQHRIVAKVDELFALCDQLEQQSENQLIAHQQLVEILLATLTDSRDADELADNWQRLADHFDLLFFGPMGEWAVDRLKNCILQLAVMGKLATQNPDDEPASELLQRIETEKARMVAEGKIKKPKKLAPIDDEEKPFELPQGWEWTHLDKVALRSEAGWSPKCEDTPREGNDWGVLKVSAVTWGVFNPEENKQLPVHLEAKSEYEVMPGDFLISRANTAELVARSVVVPSDTPRHLMMSDKIIRFVFSSQSFPEYINMFNGSALARSYYLSVAGGTSSSMKNVSRAQIQSLVMPFPPLAEQHRIVAKVDELFTLCDQLKDRLQAAGETRLNLTDALVDQALA